MDLSGIIIPVPTPFTGGEVDLGRFRSNLEKWMAWEGSSVPGGPELMHLAGILVAAIFAAAMSSTDLYEGMDRTTVVRGFTG